MKTGANKSQFGIFWRTWLLAAAVFLVCEVAGGAILTAAKLPAPAIPGAEPPSLAMMALANLLMAAGAVPVALYLGGSRLRRWLALALFVFAIGGVNTATEMRFFTTVGGELFAALSWLFPAIFAGWILARSGNDEREAGFSLWWRSRRPAAWIWRLVLAWLSYPVIYFLIGLLVAPIVVPYYRQAAGFLVIPPLKVMLPLATIRGLLFLAVSLGIIALWTGPRRQLSWRYGLAIFCVSGLYGMLLGDFFPMVLRWTHGVEILASSMAYAAAVAGLLFPPRSGYTGADSTA